MKFSAIATSVAIAASTASAFTAPSARTSSLPLTNRGSSVLFSSQVKETTATTTTTIDDKPEKDMKEFDEKVAESTAAELSAAAAKVEPVPPVVTNSAPDKSRIETGRYNDMGNSIALPFLKRPSKLDGTHAGDFGFDPFGFTEDYDLYTMQEAELRHARLAMLAVIGWPMSELLAPAWMLRENGCAPSVLNGFNPVSFLAVLTVFGAIGFFEYKTALRKNSETAMGKLHRSDMADVWQYGVAGDYNFDPLNLYSSIGDDAYARKGLREVEISHGRSAMLGITAFAAWEALTGHPIIESGSMFFHPNLVLPALVAAYYAFTSFYELEESDTFIRFTMSSEGKARYENLKISMPSMEGGGTPDFDFDTIKEFPQKAANLADTLKEKYNGLEKAYMDNVVNRD